MYGFFPFSDGMIDDVFLKDIVIAEGLFPGYFFDYARETGFANIFLTR